LFVFYSSFSVDIFLQQQLALSTTKKTSLDAARTESMSAIAPSSSSSSSSKFCCRSPRITAAAIVMSFIVGRFGPSIVQWLISLKMKCRQSSNCDRPASVNRATFFKDNSKNNNFNTLSLRLIRSTKLSFLNPLESRGNYNATSNNLKLVHTGRW